MEIMPDGLYEQRRDAMNRKSKGAVRVKNHVRCREATDQDLVHIKTWSTLVLADEPAFVGVVGDSVIAYLQYCQHPSRQTYLLITRIEVHHEYERRGYGRDMVDFLRSQPEVQALVACHVLWDAVPFWEGVGFRSDGFGVYEEDGDAGNYEWRCDG